MPKTTGTGDHAVSHEKINGDPFSVQILSGANDTSNKLKSPESIDKPLRDADPEIKKLQAVSEACNKANLNTNIKRSDDASEPKAPHRVAGNRPKVVEQSGRE